MIENYKHQLKTLHMNAMTFNSKRHKKKCEKRNGKALTSRSRTLTRNLMNNRIRLERSNV